AVPAALHQVDHALSASGKAEIATAAKNSSGIKHDALVALQKRLKHLPKASHFIGRCLRRFCSATSASCLMPLEFFAAVAISALPLALSAWSTWCSAAGTA